MAALLAAGVVTPEAVEAAQRAKESRGGKLSELLVTLGHTTDEVVADTLAAASKRMRLSERDLGARLPHPDLCRRLPQPYALGRRMLPLKLEGERLTLALADPFDHSGIREVARLLGAKQVLPQVTARGALTEATLKAYRSLGARLAGEGQPSVLLCMADEDEIARFGARLADEGFHVAHAADVPTAKMLLDSHPPAALVLGLDVKAPESLLVFARGSDAHADTPLFVTGESRDDDMLASLLDLGADDFFERPANLNLVLAKLRRALNKRAAASGAPAGPRSDDTSGASASTPSVPRLPASLMTPPPDDATPPPTFDFWENSGPLPAAPEAPPGDTSDDPPMYGEPTGVMGTLRQMAVAEIVQSLELGRKTARVELVPAEGQRGMVGFEDGQVVYAECGTVLGEDAFYELARHTEGFFRIRYGEAPSSRNIEGSTTFLLLEAMRRMDEEDGGVEGDGGEPVGAEKTPTPFE